MDGECIICLSSINDLDVACFENCYHSFCLNCTKSLVLENPICPLDRLKIEKINCKNSSGITLYSTNVTDFIETLHFEVAERVNSEILQKFYNDIEIFKSFKCRLQSYSEKCLADLYSTKSRNVINEYSKICITYENFIQLNENSINKYINELDKVEYQIGLNSSNSETPVKHSILIKINLIRILIFSNLEINFLFKHIENYLMNINFQNNELDNSGLFHALRNGVSVRFELLDKYICNINSMILFLQQSPKVSENNKLLFSTDEFSKEIDLVIKEQLDGCSVLLKNLLNTLKRIHGDKLTCAVLTENIILSNQVVIMKNQYSTNTLKIHKILIENNLFSEYLLNKLVKIASIFKNAFAVVEHEITLIFKFTNDFETKNEIVFMENQIDILKDLYKLCCDNIDNKFSSELNAIKSEIDEFYSIFNGSVNG